MTEIDLKLLLINANIQWIKRTCNIIMIDIKRKDGSNISLHVECFFKVVKDSTTLVSSNDMFLPGNKIKKRKFKWDKPGMSLFDESLLSCEEEIKQEITSAEFINNELKLNLKNGITIEIIPDTVSDSEAYILFSHDETYLACSNPK